MRTASEENERRAAEEEARRFRLLVESVRDYGIFMLTPTGHVSTWNQGAARLKGYTANEIIGRHFSVFYPAEDVAAQKTERELEGATRDGRFEDEGWRIRKDGTRFWANVVITALRNADGELIGFGKVTRDLTERKQTEERLRALAAETAALAEKARLQEFHERFIGILGHDLRNPLAALDMGVALLKRQLGADASRARVLDRMASSARRMSRMIEQILDLTRTRVVGGFEMVPGPVDLRALLAAVVDEVQIANPTAALHLIGTETLGKWDRDRLEQVFSNLVSNAVHYGAAGTPVTVTLRPERDAVSVDVHNHNAGAPIPDAIQAAVFDAYRRGTRDSRSATTAGLGHGLHISREIARAHGGDIVLHSNAGGTTFSVRLPRAAGAGSA
jgi:PAS domain S-box-containing protein